MTMTMTERTIRTLRTLSGATAGVLFIIAICAGCGAGDQDAAPAGETAAAAGGAGSDSPQVSQLAPLASGDDGSLPAGHPPLDGSTVALSMHASGRYVRSTNMIHAHTIGIRLGSSTTSPAAE